MRYLLTRAGRHTLRQFTGSRVLVAFDFDGTLAPIVRDPGRAAMRATTRVLLTRVAQRFPCAVISGRARADVLHRLGRVPVIEVIGNHGIEPRQASRRQRDAVRRWHTILSHRLDRLRGVNIEDKGYTISVHFRQARAKAQARSAIHRAVSALEEVRLVPGKQVVNVLPADAPDKGLALRRARLRHRCDTAIYVGDDDTDEDVFALGEPARLLTVRVGRKADSLAAYFLRTQREIDRFLRALLDDGPTRSRSAGTSLGR
jgi:trehalose 6-phosphate phosphatase